MRLPRFVWRWFHFAQTPYLRNPASPMGRIVLLLTTTGRKSGLPRVTPLQYEEQDGVIYVGSARGTQADWFRNLVACPRVKVQIGAQCFEGRAEPITNASRIADFLELRLRNHPRMIGAMLLAEGLPRRPSRTQLEQYASKLALVAIRRVTAEPESLSAN